MSMKLRVPEKSWVNENGTFLCERGENSYPNAKDWNLALEAFLVKGEKIILQTSILDKKLSFKEFKRQLLRMTDQTEEVERFRLLSLHAAFLEKKKLLTESTKKSYAQRLNKLKKYQPNPMVDEITVEWIRDYHYWLKNEKKLEPNTIYRELWYVRELMKIAKKKKMVADNPFDDYPLTKIKKNQVFYTWLELMTFYRLYESHSLSKNLQERLREYLFACFTGMDYADLQNLDYADLQKGILSAEFNSVNISNYYINKQRMKGSEWYFVPLVKEAFELVKPVRETGKVFPDTITNTKANHQMRQIKSIVGSKKKINFNIARHTFGTMFLNFGVRREVVQKMMGHVSPQMTDHYAKLIKSTIIKEVAHVWTKREIQQAG